MSLKLHERIDRFLSTSVTHLILLSGPGIKTFMDQGSGIYCWQKFQICAVRFETIRFLFPVFSSGLYNGMVACSS